MPGTSGSSGIGSSGIGSSGIGSSAETLYALVPDANWLPGQRFNGSASESEAAAWIEGLDLSSP